MKLHRLCVVALFGHMVMGCGGGSAKPTDAAGPDGPPQPQCNDGIDNDGDGKIDYPNDPGCVVPQQDSETDDCPDGPACPQCSNGKDDDANGMTDYPADPGCTSAGDLDEYTLNPGACGTNIMIHQLPVTGMVMSTLDVTQLFPQISTCGGGDATGIAVAAYELHLTEAKVIVASTEGSAINTVLDIRGADCQAQASELACDSTGTASKVVYSAQPGTYYILVESKTNVAGDFKLNVQELNGEGHDCLDTSECGPGLICRIPHGGTTMSCEKPVCNDGRDDDGDGKIDYPNDPGCLTPDGADETDDCPSGPNCPVCSNGMDDDNDGMTDYPADTSCSAASGASEACQGEEDPITAIVGPTTSGTLVGAHDDHDPTCGDDGGGDILYTLKIPAMRSLVLDTEGTSGDTLLSLLTATCSEPSLACDDDGGTSGHSSRLAQTNLTAGTYIVAVDNYNGDSSNPPEPYDLHVTGVISPGGSCNPADTLGGALACPASNPCEGTAGDLKCRPTVCGDGVDNDGDGKTDFPDDPGCASRDDEDETDSCPGAGPNCPECADGVDNDGDGQTDYPNDTSCTAPGQASEGCQTSEGVAALTMPVTNDDTTGANDDVHPECGSSSNTAPDHTYSMQLPALKTLSIDFDSPNFDSVIALYDSTCGGASLACEDFTAITRANVPAGNYFLVVDGYSTASGATTLTVSGTIQNGGSCEVPLAQNGAFACGPGFACAGTPGSRTCRPAACSDGLDNDGDGIADYPNDPGCTSINDTDEADTCPGGVGCPVCSDGQDNDGDGMIDYPDDPSCGAASGVSESCSTSEAIIPLVLPSTAGTTAGAANDAIPECGSSSTTTAGDLTYSLTVPALSSLTIVADAPDFSAAASLYDSTCGGTALDCEAFPATIELGAVAAGTYYYVLDGYDSDTGAYTINVSGTIENGASCEGTLAAAGALSCASGYACKGTMGARTCQVAQCSDGTDNDTDGIIDFPLEPGCTSPSDDDETDPTTPAVCANSTDDDTDGTTDFPADVGCVAAGGSDERFCVAETDPLTLITMPTTAVDLTSLTHSLTLSCQSNTGHDQVLSLSLPVNVLSLTIDTEGSTVDDTALELVDPQCAASIQCDDDGGTGLLSSITRTNVSLGNYAVAVAGYGSFGDNDGPVTLNVHGTLASGTRCDNSLFTAGVLACDTGLTCTGTPATCQ